MAAIESVVARAVESALDMAGDAVNALEKDPLDAAVKDLSSHLFGDDRGRRDTVKGNFLL